MKMRFNFTALAIFMALSASADKAHELFDAHFDEILASKLSVYEDVAYAVGRANSPRGRGDAVGYTKAEEQAKWNLGEKYRSVAPWPTDILEGEKDVTWLEYRCAHPERFSTLGMQRIYSRKIQTDGYVVVMAFPAAQVDVPAPTVQDLQLALFKVRERKRLAALRKAQEEVAERKAKERTDAVRKNDTAGWALQKEDDKGKGNVKKYENLDENLML